MPSPPLLRSMSELGVVHILQSGDLPLPLLSVFGALTQVQMKREAPAKPDA